ncbi:MAG: hypothetical protein BRC28_02170 [Nanohaloarchaea archaeon SW_4_43_9]|nr:MAG: hypothetical protein BRC28_02170 [Nanohaloarchaea archaeon SW_4_43_9]
MNDLDQEELIEMLEEYRDANSGVKLIRLLKHQLVREMQQMEVKTDKQRHELNLIIRDLEEELDYIESDKLSEFDPERQ